MPTSGNTKIKTIKHNSRKAATITSNNGGQQTEPKDNNGQ